MGGVYYVIMSGSRIADDAEAYQAACDSPVTDWVIGDDFILVVQIGTSKGPIARAYKLQWRNSTDGGSFADVGSTGDITYNATTSLVNDDPFTPNTGCTADEPTPVTGLENEGDNILPNSGTYSLADESYTEFAFALDCSNALANKEYRFQLIDVTESFAIGVAVATITMAAVSVTPKAIVDIIEGSDVFTKAIILQAKAFVDAIGGTDVFENLYRAMGFADSIAGADVFETLYREMEFVDAIGGSDVWTVPWKLLLKAFVDAIAGADVFTLTRPIYFSDSGGGSDVFTQPYREMGFADVIAGSDIFTTPFRAMGWADTGIGTEIFFLLAEKDVTDSITGTDVFTVPLKVIAVAFVDTGIGTDVFITPYREMGFSDTISGIDLFELLRFLAFADTGSGSDVFSLLRELGFADTVGGSDVFETLYREMGFSDSIAGTDVFTTPYREMEFTDVILGTDVFASAISGGMIEKFVVDTGHGLETFTHVILICPVDTIHGLDIFLVTKPEVILRITDEDFDQVGINDGPLTQILITDGALRQVNITMEDIE